MVARSASQDAKLVFFDRRMIEARDYWRKYLSRDVAVASLAPDFPRPRHAAPHDSRVSFEIGGATGERIGKVTSEKPLLVHALLLAALNVVLFRLTGAREVAVGSPSTADLPEPNALPVLNVLDPSQTFKSLLQQTRLTLLDVVLHQEYPWWMLIRDLELDQIVDRCPLFTVALSIGGYHGELPPTNHDVAVHAVFAAQRLTGHIAFSGDLFDASSIERVARSINMVLDTALANMETALSDIDLCTSDERTRLLHEWSGAATAQPVPTAFHRMFESQADRMPGASAAVFEDDSITYGELDARANRLARWLRAQGAGPEVVVGLRAGPSIARITGFLAILKAGGAVLPLEPDYPPDRIALMIADSGAKLVIGGDEADADQANLPRISDDVPPEALAYIIYTSGSTGRPKGVACTHRGLSNLAASQIRFLGVEPSSRVLQFSSFSFDASISEIAMALGSGATLFQARRDSLFPGDTLYGFLSEHAITHVTLVPSVLSLLPLKPLPDLTTLIVAGEACPGSLVEQWSPDRRFVNAYGPTEITVCASMQDCVQGDERPAIGYPMQGIEIYVLDENHQLLPPGLTGELCLGGAGVARGYLNNPAATAANFIPHPFSDAPGARLYRTGDRVRFRPDGSLDFLGRNDTQIKLRGFRIELGEIERVLAGHPLVGEVAVLCREDVPGVKRLVAYVSPSGSEEPTESGLRDYLGGPLPDYLVPEAFVVLAALPKTAKLSIARNKLPSPKLVARQTPGGLLHARDTIELGLTQIWERVLGKSPIGVRENFFELGGHSFLAIKLLSEIRISFHCDLPLPTLLQRPTIEELATAVREHQGGALAWSAVVPIRPAGSRPRIFCVHPAGGTVLCYADLAAALGPDQPFFGLQEFGLAEGQTPLARIEDMAALYVQVMKDVQPDGPYQLAGWSFGGLVTYEMARQLRGGGDEVSLLVMFDTYAPSALSPDLRYMDEVQLLISLFGDDVDLSEQHLRSLSAEDRLHHLMSKSKEVDLLPPDFTIAETRRLITMFWMNTEAVHAYEPKPYPGKVTLFFAKEKTEAIAEVTSDDPTHGWSSLAGDVTVLDADGNHHTMMRKPHVTKIGARMRELIDALHGAATAGRS
jgi:amino acid adenylation domain-containing protein